MLARPARVVWAGRLVISFRIGVHTIYICIYPWCRYAYPMSILNMIRCCRSARKLYSQLHAYIVTRAHGGGCRNIEFDIMTGEFTYIYIPARSSNIAGMGVLHFEFPRNFKSKEIRILASPRPRDTQ